MPSSERKYQMNKRDKVPMGTMRGGTMEECKHEHTVLDATGQMSFSGGDIRDTIKVRVLCLDCLQYLDEDEEASDAS